jgi:hypothetical protein
VGLRLDRLDCRCRRHVRLIGFCIAFALALTLALTLALPLTLPLALTLALSLPLALTLALPLALPLTLALALALTLVLGARRAQATDTGDPEEYGDCESCPTLAYAMHTAPSPVLAGNST